MVCWLLVYGIFLIMMSVDHCCGIVPFMNSAMTSVHQPGKPSKLDDTVDPFSIIDMELHYLPEISASTGTLWSFWSTKACSYKLADYANTAQRQVYRPRTSVRTRCTDDMWWEWNASKWNRWSGYPDRCWWVLEPFWGLAQCPSRRSSNGPSR